MAEKEYHLLEHLAKTSRRPGDREQAREDARHIADHLRRRYGASVYGIGSAFDETRRFRQSSDIDLVVESLPAGSYFEALADIEEMSGFELNLIPLESAHEHIRELVERAGVEL